MASSGRAFVGRQLTPPLCMVSFPNLHPQAERHLGAPAGVTFVIRIGPRCSVVCVHSYLVKERTLNKITKREAIQTSADRQLHIDKTPQTPKGKWLPKYDPHIRPTSKYKKP